MTEAAGVGTGLQRLRAATEALWGDDDHEDDLPERVLEAVSVLVGDAGAVALGMAPSGGEGVRVVHRGLSDDLLERLRSLTIGDLVLDEVADGRTHVPLPRAASMNTDRVPAPRQPSRVVSAPIRVASGIYGQLYVVEDGGPSGEVDAELLAVFATIAGQAVSGVRSQRHIGQQRRWEAAALRLLAWLLRQAEDDEAGAWHQLVSIVAETADAHGVAITVVDPEDPATVQIPASVGGMEAWSGRRIPRKNSITQVVVASGRPLVIPDAAADPRTAGVAERAPEVGPIAAAPVVDGAAGTLEAALIVARTREQAPFDDAESDMVCVFAAEAGAALALVRARRNHARLRRFQEREQLATELNERTLQRLIGVEIALSGLLATSPTGDHRRRLHRQFDEVSDLVKDMRRTVFEAINHLDPLDDGRP